MAADAAPECPPALLYLWGFFVEITHGLDTGGFGPSSITWVNLKAWSELTQQPVEPWEAMTLVRLGLSRAKIASEKALQESKTK